MGLKNERVFDYIWVNVFDGYDVIFACYLLLKNEKVPKTYYNRHDRMFDLSNVLFFDF
jgi:hypothetical protein